jgi:site-specific DNA-methyltransferase (adenine-specific)
MPESVTDRPTKSHEYLFLLSKNERYFYDHDAAKEPMAAASVTRLSQNVVAQAGSERANGGAKTNGPMKAVGALPKQDGHGRRHAGFNERYFGKQIKGNSKTFRGGGAYTGNRSFDNSTPVARGSHGNTPNETGLRNRRSVWEVATVGFSEAHFATFPPKLIEPCILAGCPAGGTVLDPFFGAGTTGLVADRHGRHCIGIELNPSYVEIAEQRLQKDAGLFADVVTTPGEY